MFNQPSTQNISDDRPLPLIVAEKWNFPLQVHVVDGVYWYAILDWIGGLSNTSGKTTSKIWFDIQRSGSLKDSSGSTRTMSYDDGYHAATQKDFADDKTLYLIAQHMRSTKKRPTLAAIKEYLAESGAFVDQIRLDPIGAAEKIKADADDREYRKLLDEGFTPDEARQWLIQRRRGINTRKWIVEIWVERGVTGKGFGILTNRVSEVAIGTSATARKREMKLPRHETSRRYESTANLVLIAMTELTAGGLHIHRESEGLDELLEDIDDTAPIIDAARPEVYKAFSQKPRRLRDRSNPELKSGS